MKNENKKECICKDGWKTTHQFSCPKAVKCKECHMRIDIDPRPFHKPGCSFATTCSECHAQLNGYSDHKRSCRALDKKIKALEGLLHDAELQQEAVGLLARGKSSKTAKETKLIIDKVTAIIARMNKPVQCVTGMLKSVRGIYACQVAMEKKASATETKRRKIAEGSSNACTKPTQFETVALRAGKNALKALDEPGEYSTANKNMAVLRPAIVLLSRCIQTTKSPQVISLHRCLCAIFKYIRTKQERTSTRKQILDGSMKVATAVYITGKDFNNTNNWRG